jgi:predicted GH43/DUF377 family glycosyl hydrolase
MTATLVARSPVGLVPDPSHVVGQLFVPGHALAGEREGRASSTIAHVLGLSDVDVSAALDDIIERFGERHRDLEAMFDRHATRLLNRLPAGVELSERRRQLLGATFTQEFALEAAGVCNPSAVPADDQADLAPGALRGVLSVRQIGEGHRSSIGFRSFVVGADGAVTVDPRGPYATAGTTEDIELDVEVFAGLATDLDAESIRWVVDGLGSRFSAQQLTARLSQLEAQHDTRRDVERTSRRLMARAARCYAVQFAPESDLAERALTPGCDVESNGLEDARFVRFADDDATTTYYATYTAYDGSAIAQQLLATTDFISFTSVPLLGDGAANKGLALFPRRIGGRFHALSRCDGERNAHAVSDDLRYWPTATPLDVSDQTWSSVQLGNCGTPIELDEGWLVLTHGVGAMRTYSIGALLLDLDDPTIVIGQTTRPLIAPRPDEQDGYVPNVVYSCGALRHGDHLVVPLGIADCRIGFATLSISAVLGTLLDGVDTTRSTIQEDTDHA